MLWKVILPRSRAFSLTINKKLRQFFEGLNFVEDFRDEADEQFDNIDPQKTNNLERWEEQFYLRNYNLTEQERRDRLQAAWLMTGGQSPSYLQSVLRARGFDVFVHDWWQPDEQENYLGMGSNVSFMGDQFSFMAANFGVYPAPWDPNAVLIPPYYPLVNKISQQSLATISMGGSLITMGDNFSFMGSTIETVASLDYPLPSDPVRWRHFIYVAGETMPNPAFVSPERKNELEELILSIFPAAKWVGMIVEYTDTPPGQAEMIAYNDRYDALSADYLNTVNNMVS